MSPPGAEPAAVVAARRVAEVRDLPPARRELLRSSYAAAPGSTSPHRAYPRAALAFMDWQVRRGLLNPPDHERPGSPWWRAVNERLLRDTCEARLRLLGHPGPGSSPSVEPSVRFARHPSPRTWYLAHNVTIVRAYVDHRDLAEQENRVERFFLNLVLVRVLYAHALVAAPRLALAWPAARPGRDHPRLTELYAWAAAELRVPELADLVSGSTPCYAWDPRDRDPWSPPPTGLVRVVRRALPAPGRLRGRAVSDGPAGGAGRGGRPRSPHRPR